MINNTWAIFCHSFGSIMETSKDDSIIIVGMVELESLLVHAMSKISFFFNQR